MGGAVASRPDGLRRWFHRNERRLILAWIGLLVVLNVLPFAWRAADSAWGLEDLLVRGYRWYWAQRLRVCEVRARESREAGLAEVEELLRDLGPKQLRSAVGRLRQEVLLRASHLRLGLGRVEGALEAAREMVEVDPRDHRAWSALGEALWAAGRREAAAEAFGRALALEPNLEAAVSRLVEFHLGRDDPAAALEAFTAYREAHWATRVLVGFSGSPPEFGAGDRLVIPVVVDGKRHTWRVYPSRPRGGGEARFSAAETVTGLRVLLAETAPVGVVGPRLRMLPPGELGAPAPEPLVDVEPAVEWSPVEVDAEVLPGVWTPTERWRGWEGAVPAFRPSRVAAVEVSLRLAKPVGPRLAAGLREALRRLGRGGEERALLAGMQLIPGEVTLAVAGHVRRGPEDDPPFLAALAGDLPRITAQAAALVLTGDVVWEGTSARWDRFEGLVVSRAGIPVWIAPGNHDLHDGRPGAARPRFVKRFGPTWSAHRPGSVLVLVLDTEAVPGDIGGPQLDFALAELERAEADPGITGVAVFLHRVLWFLGDERFEAAAGRANASSRPGAGAARLFMTRLLPALRSFARNRGPVAVVAGDVGTRIPLVFHREGRLVLVASGVRAQDPPAWWNHWLRLRFSGDRLDLEAVSFGGRPLGPVERFTVEFWERHPGELTPADLEGR